MTRIVIIGAAGRMGNALLRAAGALADLKITGAIVSPRSAAVGQDAGEVAGVAPLGIKLTTDLPSALAGAEVAVDFSSANATRSNLAACRSARKALLIGTTGFAADLSGEFAEAARDLPLLVAPNTSLGVTLLIELVRTAAASLPPEFDIEVIEAHHRMKRDAPSGTALALGRAAAEARGQPFEACAAAPRPPGTARRPGEIGFAVIRAGDIIGEHTVVLAGPGERLALRHEATDRGVFARGALQAAAWLAARPAGRYFMRDLLALKSGA